ncbi:MAG: ABC transporter substrate-binding protein, partial [Betaproteobacteria bacterium]
MKFVRRRLLGGIGAALVSVAVTPMASSVQAPEKKPIRVGFSIAQTGPLSGAGKSGLLALQIWRDDVNARGGMLGRPVELVVYDDQSSPALTPG